MAKFCTKCGRPLKEGEICVCQRQGQEEGPAFEQEAFFEQESGFGSEDAFGQSDAFAQEPDFTGAEPSHGQASKQQGAAGNQSYGQSAGYQQSGYQQEYSTGQSYGQEAGYQQGQTSGQAYGQQETASGGQSYNQGGAYQQSGYQQSQAGGQGSRNFQGYSSESVFQALNGVSRQVGGFLDMIYNFVTPTDRPGRVNNMVPVRKLLGFSKEDRIAQVGDCYERGMQIVPDLIQPCGQEIPIRQYDLCTTRSLLKGTWQEGKLQVTNKRVLFRLSGRNWVGRSQKSIEFALDDVVGMDIRNGNRLSFVSMILNSVIVALFIMLGQFVTELLPALGLLMGLILGFGLILLLKKHYYAKAMAFAFAYPSAIYMAATSDGKIMQALSVIITLLFFIYYILACIRPNLSFKVLTKSGSTSPIEEKRVDTVLTMLFNYFIARGMDVLPGKDAERAMDEVGTMIMDIQKFGDFGIQKWKEN